MMYDRSVTLLRANCKYVSIIIIINKNKRGSSDFEKSQETDIVLQ